jgi:hypothetical protein
MTKRNTQDFHASSPWKKDALTLDPLLSHWTSKHGISEKAMQMTIS